ncbi:uncharacterized protein PAC_08407 [Phialocephala subalpina]|uniref:Uncharacterized protein n=1 Tax=Phialocephala subalpina TaxID=576137 RepID=A0A1L7X0G6_9HELO|nr:uncharacterized protein PAC_08407 [Phialocephala subalpina]
MDPFSITTGVLTLVTRSISAVQTCTTFATKYQLSDLSIAALRTECASIRVAPLQIQNLIPRNDGNDIRQPFEQYVLEEYDAVLSACSLTFSLLNERLESLGLNGLNARNESDTASNLRFLWTEPTMETIRQGIRGQAVAITLLLTAFQSETTAKTYEIMRSRQVRRSLKSVSNDAKSLKYSVSIARARPSDLSTTSSAIGDEEFGFDDVIINSTVYRRAFMRQQSKLELRSVQEVHNEDDTITDGSNKSALMSPIFGRGAASTPSPPKNKRRLLARALRIFTRSHLHNNPATAPRIPTPDQIPEQPIKIQIVHSRGNKAEADISKDLVVVKDRVMPGRYAAFSQIRAEQGKVSELQLPVRSNDNLQDGTPSFRRLWQSFSRGVSLPMPDMSATRFDPPLPIPMQFGEVIPRRTTSTALITRSTMLQMRPLFPTITIYVARQRLCAEPISESKDFYSGQTIRLGDIVAVLWGWERERDDEYHCERGDIFEVT